MRKLILLFHCLAVALLTAQNAPKKQEVSKGYSTNKFQQNYDLYSTPNSYRTASGAPGPAYYQQQVDYKMDLILDDENKKLKGQETITYHNNSKDELTYLWVQLDQNMFAKDSKSPLIESEKIKEVQTPKAFADKYIHEGFDGGFKVEEVKDAIGKPLPHYINQTMMRVNLPQPLKSGEKFVFSIKWWYNIKNYAPDRDRSGYELLEDGNRIYVMAQFFPRMCVYNDVEGWQNMQFWGRGEFTLPFGNYEVNITTPSDHVLEATGDLMNRKDVLTAAQLSRYDLATKSYDKPVVVVTSEEALAAEKGFSKTTKTWKFKATNVRDFAFSTSRTFIYDAMAVKQENGGKDVMAISVYPNIANPLWGEHSTRAIAQTIKTYSRFTFEYPYPKAVSVSAEDQGMEYPMICWNYGRPDKNGKTPDFIKYGMISVIIHEVGHNYFPMIINSDERQWKWMDEGLNTFMQYHAEQDYMKNYPSSRFRPRSIVPYMKRDQAVLEPIMSNSETYNDYGSNGYFKPAIGLHILRETILGPEQFDFAFKTYANRWKFKHPYPEDFFRTMEDATAYDLDWFWRAWFYSTDYVDMAIKQVVPYYVTTQPTEEQKKANLRRGRFGAESGPFLYLTKGTESTLKNEDKKGFDWSQNENLSKYINDNYSTTEKNSLKEAKYFYEVTFEKLGQMIMPLLVELTYEDGTKENHRIPEQIWAKGNETATRVFSTAKKVTKIEIDPKMLTADVDETNNVWKE
jgi:hypothetical protein